MILKEKFRDLLRPLSTDEYESLKTDLLVRGCLDPLKTWSGILVDGHNRYEICTKNNIVYKVEALNFESEDEAIDWMLANQLGRRNLTRDDFTLLLGRRYNAQKKSFAESGSLPQNDAGSVRTSEKLAKEHGVSRATVERAGAKAQSIDSASTELKDAVRNRETSVSDAAVVAGLPPEQQSEIVATGDTKSAAQEIRRERKSLVTQNTGNNEWYTPERYIEAARKVLGAIDCDPASNDFAQKTVKAKTFYTIDDSGLDANWFGAVWMNPPYGKGLVDKFITRYCEQDGITEGIVLVNNATDTDWFQRLAGVSSAICLKKGRIKYIAQDGIEKNTPIQGQVFLYRGDDVVGFECVFGEFGAVARLLS